MPVSRASELDKDPAGGHPLIVAWDTCTPRGTLAVGTPGGIRAEAYFRTEKGHTGWLMPLVDSTLSNLGLAPGDVDAVAVGTGPGTFTGVKVGVTTGKSVSMALDIPLLGISTLDILAAGGSPDADLLLSVIDARRGKVYAAVYRPAGALRERVSDYVCAEPRGVADAVLSIGFESLLLVGQTPAELPEMLGARGGRVVRGTDPFPQGRRVLELAGAMVSAGGSGTAVSVLPLYLKKPI